MAKIHFLVNINMQKYRQIRVFDPKILILIIFPSFPVLRQKFTF
ncbi:hypothetical protein [Mesomycoplasma ovipneumoniae]